MDTDKQTSEHMYSGRLIESLIDAVRRVDQADSASASTETATWGSTIGPRGWLYEAAHTLCAYCYWPRYTHAQGKYQWCPVDNGGEVFAALLCDYCGAESRDGLADGEMCGAGAVVVGVESGQCYCLRHWERAQ
jgi:hypothetical protein